MGTTQPARQQAAAAVSAQKPISSITKATTVARGAREVARLTVAKGRKVLVTTTGSLLPPQKEMARTREEKVAAGAAKVARVRKARKARKAEVRQQRALLRTHREGQRNRVGRGPHVCQIAG